MSHFLCVAFINPETQNLNDLLDPYDEGKQVDEYEEECWCVGRTARHEVEEAVRVEFDPALGVLRARNEAAIAAERAKPGNDGDGFYFGPHPDVEDEFDKLFTQRSERVEALMKAHPSGKTADPGCEDCRGTGKRTSAYNPLSQWDWWQVGGRFTGVFSVATDQPYDPSLDPENQEPCNLCDATGRRHWKETPTAPPDPDEAPSLDAKWKAKLDDGQYVVREAIERDTPGYVERACNGCDGTGIKRKWPTEWKGYKGDVIPVAEYAARLMAAPEALTPYAILDNDGAWHQRGKMGWFGMSSNEMTRDEWAEAVRKLAGKAALADEPLVAVALDMHI